MTSAPVRRPDAACVVVAAGRSTRFAGGSPGLRKPWLELGGRTLLEHACAAFAASGRVARIVLVVHADDLARAEALVERSPALERVRAVVRGGQERADSVRAGVRAVGPGPRLVAVHDAARPLVTTALVDAALAAAESDGAAVVAIPVRDTVKESEDGRSVARTLERERLWSAQTPQAFRLERFLEVLERAEQDGERPTDDAALWERYVGPVTIVRGDPSNLKVTGREDLALAEALLAARAGAAPSGVEGRGVRP